MAVPKKRASKAKKRVRKSAWKQKAIQETRKAFSLSKAVLTCRTHFVYPTDSNSNDPPKGFEGREGILIGGNSSVE
uniref:ribosomal protein L32 n=1 Tax=Klebsormidium dissectum TaxID=329816 RepID=UPI00286A0814|nr:ribosomal protein L32 [Klebsormidium dissectum]YP_010932702.1 ribosomal protein L32 [Klebsormidium dissectum]WKT07737.1 ribosomal protein L32 [Klebsormidium sp. SEV1-VF17pt]WKT06542.1 ribosomal protein L32 [Klebsormidium dissectum]WKT06543.1 ribosomal protein L32 [Klebsormidium dissectum]WKT06649.1 ribosomal protein L32 [Klebsormidium dissectum]WKT06650.1 ribosomal protein L32 [Klebsormidium dissectum]